MVNLDAFVCGDGNNAEGSGGAGVGPAVSLDLL